MKINAVLSLIDKRISADHFDASHAMSDALIGELVRLATRAPTAYNLQNWRFIAVKTSDSKARLRALAYNQAKVSDAAVTFIVCGLLPDHTTLAERLAPFVDAGHMRAEVSASWQDGARTKYADPQEARDEALRSASLGAATLMYAAQGMGFASSPMGGFDAAGVARAFGLQPDEVPVMLVPVGRPAPGNRPQKPRRPITEVLKIA
ncbi:nitroreductase family protein [Trinickia soli]|uniref:nitroreductase family protein n=1 Tax=Trinickia soli TaxID=380675 RepID=UPI003FA34A31